jgi:hypothetical protein
MNLRERLRRWWKPADYADEHPLTDEERQEQEGHQPAFTTQEELGDLGGGLGPGVHPEDEFRR